MTNLPYKCLILYKIKLRQQLQLNLHFSETKFLILFKNETIMKYIYIFSLKSNKLSYKNIS